MTGTRIHALEALSCEQGLRVRAVVPAQLGDYARAVLTGLANVEIVEEWLSQRSDHDLRGAFRQHRVDLRNRYDKTEDGLVDLNGLIPPDLRRPLLAIDSRPALRRMIFGSIRAAYVGGYRVRHAGRPPKD